LPQNENADMLNLIFSLSNRDVLKRKLGRKNEALKDMKEANRYYPKAILFLKNGPEIFENRRLVAGVLQDAANLNAD
jgi:hypothetical protein